MRGWAVSVVGSLTGILTGIWAGSLARSLVIAWDCGKARYHARSAEFGQGLGVVWLMVF